MSVVLEKSTIPGPGHHAEHLRLNDPSCTLDSNGTHLFTNISLNDCGTVMEEDDDSLIFRNEIVSYDDPNDIITRKHEVEIEISCKYQKRNNVTVEFDAHRPAINITERGFGTFTYEFEFYDSPQFTDRKDPNSYPLEYEVGEMMYLQIESSSPVPNTEIFVESCSATPYDNPSYPLAYPIIVNGCGVDDTLKTFTSHQSDFKFGLQAFKFIGLYDQVFITCSIILCEAGNPNTRCSEGCSNTTAAFSVPHRHRRDAPIQTGNHYISQGPLRLRRSTGRSEVSGTQKLDLNLVFVAGCLLAAVGMVCGVMVIRTRRTHRREVWTVSLVKDSSVPLSTLAVRAHPVRGSGGGPERREVGEWR
ncbi:CUB and zona pellucida-like domain-containing protein 1 [Chanos chanos]|uniref:CUB and zona pellucida-like domain-containing protein 1 n=1 Tax=Chanos chanos TaxID=29144 RepID=A0A6J2VRM0_CHACN|nr:CUB and zona pellucida-like domain-containing protein 1 [Chanos chanos]